MDCNEGAYLGTFFRNNRIGLMKFLKKFFGENWRYCLLDVSNEFVFFIILVGFIGMVIFLIFLLSRLFS